MRRKDRQIMDKNEIFEIIRSARVCRLGLCKDNVPYVVALNFGFVEAEIPVFYFHCAKEGKKIDFIKSNNNVCIQFDLPGELIRKEKACGWGMTFQSVAAFGKAEIIQSKEEKIAGLNAIMKQYSGRENYSFDDDALSATSVIKIIISQITGKKKNS